MIEFLRSEKGRVPWTVLMILVLLIIAFIALVGVKRDPAPAPAALEEETLGEIEPAPAATEEFVEEEVGEPMFPEPDESGDALPPDGDTPSGDEGVATPEVIPT